MNYEITGHTRLTALLGSPVSHSISPQMHNEAFRKLGLDYAYLAFEVQPQRLEEAFAGLKAIGICGFNLTMPLKTAILPLLDELTPAARLAQSVNTVFLRDGAYVGHTTDGIGYMQSVSHAGYDIIGKKMTLLGAGGAATAICVQAALDGVAAIDVFKRKNNTFLQTADFFQQLSSETGCEIRLLDLADSKQLSDSISQSRILTNATNVGMAPDVDSSIIADPGVFHKDLIVSDIIYNPRETKLLKQAKACGCCCFNGLHMLLFQGAAAFKCWTGQDMPVEHIKETYFSE